MNVKLAIVAICFTEVLGVVWITPRLGSFLVMDQTPVKADAVVVFFCFCFPNTLYSLVEIQLIKL